MIGVVVQPADEAIAREFFELFKTPWEFVRSPGRYEVLLCIRSPLPEVSAPLVLCFHGQSPPPETVAVFVTEAGASAATFTVSVRGR